MIPEKLHFEKGHSGFINCFEGNLQGRVPRLHSHRELELNVVFRGTGTYYIQGQQYSISPGNVLWLFSGQPHVLADFSADLQMWVVVFRTPFVRQMSQPDWTQDLTKRDPGTVYVRGLNRMAFDRLEHLCRCLAATAADDHAYFNACLGCLLREAWESTRSGHPLAVGGKVHPAVERVVRRLKSGPLNEPLAALAREAGLSYSRLGYLFHEQMGETLGDYRKRLRVQRFQYLAASHPNRTLLDCALEAGFGSYAQAHRVIREGTGMSPRELAGKGRPQRKLRV
jgi:AraC-like DNA-binding protein